VFGKACAFALRFVKGGDGGDVAVTLTPLSQPGTVPSPRTTYTCAAVDSAGSRVYFGTKAGSLVVSEGPSDTRWWCADTALLR
jgi:hypothetical protein